MSSRHISRRAVLRGGLAAFIAGWAPLPAALARSRPLGFTAILPSAADAVTVAPGYRVQVLYRWGDETGIAGAPAAPFRDDASNSAEEQALQAGMHHDAIHYFPLGGSSARGLLAMNHEYTDDGLLHTDGTKTWSAEKVRKSQNAHGVSVIEVRRDGNAWRVVRPSRYARRITARTPMALSGPAAGHALLRTAADPAGREALGTLNNCAHGVTPWDTYLACEENFNGYFSAGDAIPPDFRRYGIVKGGRGYRWHEHDERFDAATHPNEPNRFGWVVEIDPFDPRSKPVKRTALGRFKHEGATVALAKDGRVAVYMGDDEAFEYIYKYVSNGRYQPGNHAANVRLLDEGKLYAARFEEGGRGPWLALGADPQVLVHARAAADAAGATKMDRPEWIAVHPATQEVYCSLTHNSQRGAEGRPGPDAANPRARNVYGHIVRWREAGGDAAALEFGWDVFLLAGEDKGFGSPDGLWFDARGLLWIQTDVSHRAMYKGPYAGIGSNQMLAADVTTGELRRFLVGPPGCEVTGVTETPDGTTFFVNIQHPGEPTSGRNSDPAEPGRFSRWPDMKPGGRPRSATIAIRREDGGIVGT